ncbi:uncharacterized protein A1O9_09893 [Exophiala aquamarina CBS 119918]|uniref:Uncharacterized protein n=1 Tax=Exophiala aquamarina CBS 119918 TaxID=1182545 RepID=A0A072P4A4_9EURO|nr:uncharacterized protein A1O9_09893 [Exophiala aquamarina CBS 119918]KEF54098.1 hypothetical protein A1O9_09893 [Exophiala aquamarina CBS 119918]
MPASKWKPNSCCGINNLFAHSETFYSLVLYVSPSSTNSKGSRKGSLRINAFKSNKGPKRKPDGERTWLMGKSIKALALKGSYTILETDPKALRVVVPMYKETASYYHMCEKVPVNCREVINISMKIMLKNKTLRHTHSWTKITTLAGKLDSFYKKSANYSLKDLSAVKIDTKKTKGESLGSNGMLSFLGVHAVPTLAEILAMSSNVRLLAWPDQATCEFSELDLQPDSKYTKDKKGDKLFHWYDYLDDELFISNRVLPVNELLSTCRHPTYLNATNVAFAAVQKSFYQEATEKRAFRKETRCKQRVQYGLSDYDSSDRDSSAHESEEEIESGSASDVEAGESDRHCEAQE